MQNGVVFEAVLVQVTAPDSAAGLQSHCQLHIVRACDTAKQREATAYRGQEYLENFKISPLLPYSSDHNGPLAELELSFNWERGDLLGAGAFGLVHVVNLLGNSEQLPQMAVKTISIQEASDRQLAFNEIKVMHLLHHDNVVAFFGI